VQWTVLVKNAADDANAQEDFKIFGFFESNEEAEEFAGPLRAHGATVYVRAVQTPAARP
jgi:hypothetical protein